MAKPNYSFEKRQRELKKLKQQEEKRQKKLAAKEAPSDAESRDTQPADAPEATPE